MSRGKARRHAPEFKIQLFQDIRTGLDACSRKVVGYAIWRNIDTTLVLAALRSAVQSRKPSAGRIFYTERGSQYASESHRGALQEAGLRGSISGSDLTPVVQLQGFTPVPPHPLRPNVPPKVIGWQYPALERRKKAP